MIVQTFPEVLQLLQGQPTFFRVYSVLRDPEPADLGTLDRLWDVAEYWEVSHYLVFSSLSETLAYEASSVDQTQIPQRRLLYSNGRWTDDGLQEAYQAGVRAGWRRLEA